MNRMFRGLAAAWVAAAIMTFPGCEWESSDGVNTSQGAGVSVNFSGIYTARSTELVSGTALTQFVLTQVGNTIEVWDSNSAYYTGTVGSPGVAEPETDGTYGTGATMLQSQVNFSGNGVSFIGIIRAVAAINVSGTSTTDQSVDTTLDGSVDTTQAQTASTSSSGTGSTTATSDTTTESTTETTSLSTNQTQSLTITDTDGGDTVSIGSTITSGDATSSGSSTTAGTSASSGTSVGTGTASQSVDDTTTTSGTATETGTATVTTKTYIVDEGTAHYVLEGNWTQNGVTHTVNGIAVAVGGTFSVLWDVDTSTVASSQDLLDENDIGTIDATADSSSTTSSSADALDAAQTAQEDAGGGAGGAATTTATTTGTTATTL